MKIHKLGNDYAYQQRLKNKAANIYCTQSMVEPQSDLIENVEHQIPAGGEREMATVNDDATLEGQAASHRSRKTSRKKKKEKDNDIQQMPEVCEV